jgi:hypothetical protein
MASLHNSAQLRDLAKTTIWWPAEEVSGKSPQGFSDRERQ